MKKTVFTGSAVALITPFKDGNVDYGSLEKLIEFQISSGTQALVVCGTTGEPATMSPSERSSVISFCIRHASGRVPVIVGTGANCTSSAVQNSTDAEAAGADALLVVTPYYNKCSANGLFLHYKAVCDAVHIPVIAYSVPSRTGVNITAAAANRLASIDNLVAIKEASGNIDQISDIAATCGDALDIYSGDDGIVVPLMSIGAKGVISVAANIVPADVQKMCALAAAGDFTAAASVQKKLFPLVKALFCEVNPIPVKTAAGMLGLCEDGLRMPLCAMEDANRARLADAMRAYGLKF